MPRIRTSVAGALVSLLVGCTSAQLPPAAQQPPGRAATAEATTAGELGARLNAYRRANGRGALAPDAGLAAAARDQATFLARGGRFSHVGRGGSELGERIAAAGVRACLAAENLSGGRDGAAAVIGGWSRSAGHRRNMLLGDVGHYGAARSGDIWVLVLARKC